MQNLSNLSNLSNDALLEGLHGIVRSHRGVTAELIRHLGEMDVRRLAVERGFSSLFSYAVERLGFSEDEACRRIEAARIARRFPAAHALLESGAVSLTVLCLLKPHLTPENHRGLLEGVSGASVRQAKEWLAARFPQPDVPASIRKLPARHSISTLPWDGGDTRPDRASAPPREHATGPDRASAPLARTEQITPPERPAPEGSNEALRVGKASSARQRPIGWLEPLSAERFVMKLTVSRELRNKIETARDLMRHANPEGSLDVLIERALDLLLIDLGRKQQGWTERPLSAPRPAKPSHVSRAARREVAARESLKDSWQCSFVSDDGRRCGSRAFVEVDHRVPRGLGGDGRPDNLRLLCRAHNHLEAERAYGRRHVAQAISRSREKRRAGLRPRA